MKLKTLRTVKQIDLHGQIIVTILTVIYSIYIESKHTRNADITILLSAYFKVGAWQLSSTAVHFFLNEKNGKWKARGRKFYNLAILVTLFFVFLLKGNDLLWMYMCLFFGAPMLAMSYFAITIRESKKINRLIEM